MATHVTSAPGGRVIAAIDASIYAHPVAAYAAWAAQRLGAPLELLHVIERNISSIPADLSGNLALGSQEVLMAELASLDEQRAKLAQAHGRALLEQVVAKLGQHHDIDPSMLQRHGTLVDSLLELESASRLFVLGKRGEQADMASNHIGSTLERVVRSVHRPILVASRNYNPVTRFMIAYDGSATTRKCVDMVCASPLLSGLDCEVLMVADPSDTARQHMDWALERLAQAGYTPRPQTLPGNAESVIARQVAVLGVDLVVMGAYGHSRIRNMIVGSTTTQVLRDCPIPVLLLR